MQSTFFMRYGLQRTNIHIHCPITKDQIRLLVTWDYLPNFHEYFQIKGSVDRRESRKTKSK